MSGKDDEHKENVRYERGSRKSFELKLTQSAFLGGITFAAMVLVMQAKDNFIFLDFTYYPDILITSLAGISFLFILSSITLIDVASGLEKTKSKVSTFADNLTLAAWFSILIIIPLIVLPFTLIGAIVLGIIEIVVTVKWLLYIELPH